MEENAELTKGGAQERANQLTRELHGIDDTNDAIQYLRKKIPPSELAGATEETNGNVNVEGAAAAAPETAKPAQVQKGIESFFKPAVAKKMDTSAVIVLDDEDEPEPEAAIESSEVQDLSPPKRPASDEDVAEEASPAKKPRP